MFTQADVVIMELKNIDFVIKIINFINIVLTLLELILSYFFHITSKSMMIFSLLICDIFRVSKSFLNFGSCLRFVVNWDTIKTFLEDLKTYNCYPKFLNPPLILLKAKNSIERLGPFQHRKSYFMIS